MKTFKRFAQTTFIAVSVFSFLFLNASWVEAAEVNKTFKAKDTVQIHTVSGDCVVKKGKNGEIKVTVNYTYPSDRFEPVFEEEGGTLILKEEFHNTDDRGSIRGKSDWTVIVPEKTGIGFKSASGDLKLGGLKGALSVKVASGDIDVKGFKGHIKVKSASGHIHVTDYEGGLKVKTASGDIKLDNVKGEFDGTTSSGDVEASGIEFTGESELGSVSGDVDIRLAKSPGVDINFEVVSGDVTLDYNGNPVKGYFTFKGMVKKFSSPFPFDNEEEKGYSPFGTRYVKKGDSPKITLKAVSGKLTLKK